MAKLHGGIFNNKQFLDNEGALQDLHPVFSPSKYSKLGYHNQDRLKGKLRGKFTKRVDRAGNRETDVITVNSVFLTGVALPASGRLPSSIPLTIEMDK